jgi:prophage tail gpP-like protein
MSGAGGKNKIVNPILSNIYRPHVQEKGDTSDGNLLNSAKAELGRKVAAAVDIKAIVPSWIDPSGNMYLENSTISMMSPKNMLYKWHDYFIKNIVYKKNENDMHSEMTLCFPECYNGQILSDFPWQEVFPSVPESPLSLLDKIKAATTI